MREEAVYHESLIYCDEEKVCPIQLSPRDQHRKLISKILPSKMTCVKFLRLHPGVSCRDTLNFKNRIKGDLTTETHVLYVMFLSAPSAPDVSDCIAPCPPSRSRTFRWTVSRTTWRPKRSCCSGPSGWWRDTRACAATTSPPAGGMANSSTPSYTNTGEADVRARN